MNFNILINNTGGEVNAQIRLGDKKFEIHNRSMRQIHPLDEDWVSNLSAVEKHMLEMINMFNNVD